MNIQELIKHWTPTIDDLDTFEAKARLTGFDTSPIKKQQDLLIELLAILNDDSNEKVDIGYIMSFDLISFQIQAIAGLYTLHLDALDRHMMMN